MGATIIISFLSLMSFADFLRVLWQQPGGQQQDDQEAERRENEQAEGLNMEDEADGNATDDRIIEIIEKDRRRRIREEGLLNNNSSMTNNNTTTIPADDTNDMGGLPEDIVLSDFDSLRTRATELRNLAMEREARRQIDDGERDLVDGDGDADQPEMDPLLPLADDFVDIPRRDDIGNVDELDYDSDGVEIDENADDNEEAWMDNDDDENDEDQIPLFPPPGGEPVDFDPMDPVLQDDQVVSSILVAWMQIPLVVFSHDYLLLSIRIWKSMLRWMNYLAFEVQ